MNFSAFGSFPAIHHQFATAVTSSSTPSSTQENRYTSYQAPSSSSSANPVKFRAEDMASTNVSKYTHYPTASSTHLQYGYNTTPQQNENPKTSYIHTSNVVTTSHTTSELSQDITSLLLKDQSVGSDSTKRVLQSSSVADYLSHLPTLHHFLKYSAETAAAGIKKETVSATPSSTQSLNLISSTSSIASIIQPIQQQVPNQTNLQIPTSTSATSVPTTTTKKKKKKKAPKEKKTKKKHGEIFLKFALDGTMLFVCPECQVAYPEKEILDQHMVGHHAQLERRFICEICNAALKRKDHLTRHKQSHNPERNFICHCLKAFKRKEQLSLHAVIHSGNKKHSCVECNKGFYRKDHLRKHMRSHIARRLKAELSQQQPASNQSNQSEQQQQNQQPDTQMLHIQQQNC